MADSKTIEGPAGYGRTYPSDDSSVPVREGEDVGKTTGGGDTIDSPCEQKGPYHRK